MTERTEALEYRAARLATAADLLWRCAIVIAGLMPILEAIITARFPVATLLSAATLLLVCWVVREFLFVTVAHAEVVAEQAAAGTTSTSAVDPDPSRSTSS